MIYDPPDPGMCDTFTTDEPPAPKWHFYIGDQDITDELDPELADDAILAGILRRAMDGRFDEVDGVSIWTGNDGIYLPITETERAALCRAAGQPLP